MDEATRIACLKAICCQGGECHTEVVKRRESGKYLTDLPCYALSGDPQKSLDALLTALQSKGWVVVPVEPTEEQLNAARDWSVAKYGQGVGNDGAKGCYAAMLSAAPMNDLLRAQTRSTEADRSAG